MLSSTKAALVHLTVALQNWHLLNREERIALVCGAEVLEEAGDRENALLCRDLVKAISRVKQHLSAGEYGDCTLEEVAAIRDFPCVPPSYAWVLLDWIDDARELHLYRLEAGRLSL